MQNDLMLTHYAGALSCMCAGPHCVWLVWPACYICASGQFGMNTLICVMVFVYGLCGLLVTYALQDNLV
jgi:hypothetical protein